MPNRDKFSDLLKQGYSLHKRLKSINAIVIANPEGELELWGKNDNHASYGIIFENHDYEFQTSNIEAIDSVIKHNSI